MVVLEKSGTEPNEGALVGGVKLLDAGFIVAV